MKEKIYDARTGMEYVLVGDYYLPALKLPRTRPIGRWGMLHKAYLKLRKPAYYQSLLLSGKLDTVLANVEEQVAERYKVLIEQMSQREETSEKLKEENQMECGLEVAIKNIINASYSRDLSAKIAAADHVMQKKGMYLGGYRPFGFLPDPSDCHKLILDPVASRYVRLIFELALQGNRTGTIAKILNEKQIPTPAAYHVAESHVYSEQKSCTNGNAKR